METLAMTLNISSPVFKSEGRIPKTYTCDGENINPPIAVANIPEGAKSLALILEDPDAPGGVFDHWTVWDIPLETPISEGSNPGIAGKNSQGSIGYMGPCPPPETGTHRYFFKLFALDCMIMLKTGSTKAELMRAMEGHILATGELIGLYHRKQ